MVMRFTSLFIALCASLLAVTAAQAQTLDSEYERLLSNTAGANCANLGTNGPGLGPNLAAICAAIPNGAGSSGGGNSSASNAAGVTVEARRKARLGDESEQDAEAGLGGGLSAFVSLDYEALDRDRTTFEDGFDSDVWRAVGGVDLLVSDTLLVGLLFSYANNSGDYQGGGDFDTDTYSPTVFASFLPMPNVFADLSVSYTRNEYDRERRATFNNPNTAPPLTISGPISSDYGGDQVGIGLGFGYDYVINNITVGPRAGLNYSYENIEGYRETGGTGLELRVRDQHITSLQTRVGLDATMAISTPIGVVSPQIGWDYVHEFENDQRNIKVRFVEDFRPNAKRFRFQNQSPDRDFFHIGGGLALSLPNGIQPFANFRALLGHRFFDNYVGTIGVRFEL